MSIQSDITRYGRMLVPELPEDAQGVAKRLVGALEELAKEVEGLERDIKGARAEIVALKRIISRR